MVWKFHPISLITKITLTTQEVLGALCLEPRIKTKYILYYVLLPQIRKLIFKITFYFY